MAFDWQDFLDRRGIEYAERGKSTAKNNIYVHCPFCGDSDTGHHMGISLDGKGWGCWREQQHRGRNPTKLVQALLGISWQEAQGITGSTGRAPASATLLGAVRTALGMDKPSQAESKTELTLLKQFLPLRTNKPSPHLSYMRKRKFSDEEIEWLTKRFKLHVSWVAHPHWAWRIIIPVYDMRKRLVTWTGRAVGETKLRYRSLSSDPEKQKKGEPLALGPISDYFLDGRRAAKGGRFLVLCEGPFDCMRLALEAGEFDARVTCFFGKAISPAQLDTLARIRDRYDAVFLLLDAAEKASAMRMASNLTALQVKPFYLEGKKDPGEMTAAEVRALFKRMEAKVSGNRN